ncbi:Cytosine/adenosine deaminase [Arboricoccus pini]|uniref:Cytosine/adenosine deaminase n=1 Tax=Arboricoccus pini TaxID=1963835 RepID=A0A212RVF7_9PROT|nr:amidohydrolase family protein [Arboricoccus pini]SNB76534.1 Cytosine/adenosine deaminase [Arboricoccus pini]
MCLLCGPINRRRFGALAGLAASDLAAPAASSLAAAVRGEYLIRAGRVLTMEPGGDVEGGAVHVRDGWIVAVGKAIEAPGATLIDRPDAVLMPGLIDTHWHMWNSVGRGLAGGQAGYWPAWRRLAPAFRPDDNYLGARLALAEAAYSGITTVHNWSHNTRGYDHAMAEIRAHRESGLRGRFAFGYPQEMGPGARMDFAALERVQSEVGADDGLTSLGMCVRGPERSEAAIWREEWAFARAQKLPLSVHIAITRELAKQQAIATLAREGLLGPDIQLVHATHATVEDARAIAASGSPVSLSPWTELRVGFGIPPIGLLHDAGVKLSLSIDNTPLAGNADFFNVMKIALNIAAGSAERQEPIPARTFLEWATIGGASDLGLADVTGSIRPHKRADLILVDMADINTGPTADLDAVLTHAAQPANVSFVMADGRILKEAGRLKDVDVPALVHAAEDALAGIRARAGQG